VKLTELHSDEYFHTCLSANPPTRPPMRKLSLPSCKPPMRMRKRRASCLIAECPRPLFRSLHDDLREPCTGCCGTGRDDCRGLESQHSLALFGLLGLKSEELVWLTLVVVVIVLLFFALFVRVWIYMASLLVADDHGADVFVYLNVVQATAECWRMPSDIDVRVNSNVLECACQR
jgi:hypothetical protein